VQASAGQIQVRPTLHSPPPSLSARRRGRGRGQGQGQGQKLGWAGRWCLGLGRAGRRGTGEGPGRGALKPGARNTEALEEAKERIRGEEGGGEGGGGKEGEKEGRVWRWSGAWGEAQRETGVLPGSAGSTLPHTAQASDPQTAVAYTGGGAALTRTEGGLRVGRGAEVGWVGG